MKTVEEGAEVLMLNSNFILADVIEDGRGKYITVNGQRVPVQWDAHLECWAQTRPRE